MFKATLQVKKLFKVTRKYIILKNNSKKKTLIIVKPRSEFKKYEHRLVI